MKEKGSGAKMKPSGIGGMSVMEGVMMKNKDIYAVAVRKPDNEIAVEVNTHKDFADKVKLFQLPIFRGMLAFVDSLVVGIKVLNYSASFFEEEEETQTPKKKDKQKKSKDKDSDTDFEVEDVASSYHENDNKADTKTVKKEDNSNALFMALAVLISIVMSVGLFMVLPVIVTNLFSKVVTNHYLLAFIEGVVRLVIFIGYIILASQMKEIKRVFMYHGAEHKTINCIENGFELTVENVKWQSKQHKRCGTSFMLLVVLISLVFFMIIPSGNLLWRVLSRIILVPFIAGVSYEFIRFAGKSESKVVNVISQPGLWMQGLTTKEPDDSMIEVAIKSVEAVFDWRAFLEKYRTGDSGAKAAKGKTQQKKAQTNVKNSTKKQQETKQQPTNQEAASSKQAAAKNNAKTAQEGKKQPASGKVSSQTKEPNKASDISAAALEESKPRTEIKAQVGGLAYTGKVEAAEKHSEVHPNQLGRNKGIAPVSMKPNIQLKSDEEDDDILKALDKFFDDGHSGED